MIFCETARISSIMASSLRWLLMASFIKAACSELRPRLTVFPETFRVHLHADGGCAMTLPWLNNVNLPSSFANSWHLSLNFFISSSLMQLFSIFSHFSLDVKRAYSYALLA